MSHYENSLAGLGSLSDHPDAEVCDDCEGSGMELTGVEYMGIEEVGGCQGCAGTGAINYQDIDAPSESV